MEDWGACLWLKASRKFFTFPVKYVSFNIFLRRHYSTKLLQKIGKTRAANIWATSKSCMIKLAEGIKWGLTATIKSEKESFRLLEAQHIDFTLFDCAKPYFKGGKNLTRLDPPLLYIVCSCVCPRFCAVSPIGPCMCSGPGPGCLKASFTCSLTLLRRV